MRRDLMEFLFSKSALEEADEVKLAEGVIKIFEEADELEKVTMAADKKPLADALRKIGVSAKVEAYPQWCEVLFDDQVEYQKACDAIFTPDGMYAMAEAGWVPSKSGDQAMSNETPSFKLGFFEIGTAGEDSEDKDKGPALKDVVKDGREADTAELERDSELNPIENPDDEMGGKREGVGKAADGKDPEGKPKGSVSEGKHKEGCACGFCKNKGRFGKKDKAEEPSAKEIAEKLLEMTSTSGVPAISEPPLAAMRPPTPHRNRMDKLRRRTLREPSK